MSNGNGGHAALKAVGIVGLVVTVSVGITGIGMSIMSDRITAQGKLISALSTEIEVKTKERYTKTDARDDFLTANDRMGRIEARADRYESQLSEHIREHSGIKVKIQE